MVETIQEILMRRDNLSAEEAENQFLAAQDALNEMLENEGDIDEANFCANWFGLEPDYIMELL